MNKNIKILLGSLIVLAIGGGAFGYWYNNQLAQSRINATKTPSRAVSSMPNKESSSGMSSNKTEDSYLILKTGTFTKLDPLHYASGNVKIIKDSGNLLVEFQDNFATNPDGPDLHVWLVKKQALGGAVAGVDTSVGSYVDLGVLTKFSGKQSYSIKQSELDSNGYAVVIWCQAFNVQFSNAVLN